MNPIKRPSMFRMGRLAIFSMVWLAAVASRAAEEFGDISVSAAAMYTGNTFHGYAAMQVTVENRSTQRAHGVSLIYPNNGWNNGNSIGRLSRTVTVQPGSREVVLLLQPPLPSNGDGNIRVEVDGRHEGEVRAPNVNNHCSGYSGRGGQAAIFVSRSLNYDAVEHVFDANRGGFAASMAVGAPDASGYGMQTATWVPDARRYGMSNWLELDYAVPQIANKIVVYSSQSPVGTGSIILVGTASTNILSIPMSSGVRSSSGSGWIQTFTFPDTTLPVKTVRLDFAKAPPYNIAIDAVSLSGATNSQWASDARASSDNSASASSYSGGGAAQPIESLRSESSVSDWSENWLAYSAFDGVVVSLSDMNSMTPAVQTAIGDYLQAGGTVVLPGSTGLPAAWHAFDKKKLQEGAEYSVGLGHCFILPEDPAAFGSQTVQLLRERVRDAARYWQSLPDDDNAANTVMPVVQNLKIPARGIVIIMVAFIVIIGPVNLIYLSRRNRRTWMLWTIPAISLVTTLLVFVYSLLREGITPDTRIAGLTLIDQNSHHSATVGGLAYYCPLTPSGGLNFEYETEATPLVHMGYGGGIARELDWTQSQHFTHGWVSARIPAHFLIRKSGAARERIQIVNENGKPAIINGLGAPVKSLWYVDADMHLYKAQNIAAGEKTGMIPATPAVAFEKAGAQSLLRDAGYTASAENLGNPEKYLTPNTYIAVLDGNPFIENALGASASAKRTHASSVVFGILEPSENP